MTAYEAKQIAYNSVEGKTQEVFDDVMRCIKDAAGRGEMQIEHPLYVDKFDLTVYVAVKDMLIGLGYSINDNNGSTITWYHAQPDKI